MVLDKLDTGREIGLIELVRNVPSKRTKLSPLLHCGVEKSNSVQDRLPLGHVRNIEEFLKKYLSFLLKMLTFFLDFFSFLIKLFAQIFLLGCSLNLVSSNTGSNWSGQIGQSTRSRSCVSYFNVFVSYQCYARATKCSCLTCVILV